MSVELEVELEMERGDGPFTLIVKCEVEPEFDGGSEEPSYDMEVSVMDITMATDDGKMVPWTGNLTRYELREVNGLATRAFSEHSAGCYDDAPMCGEGE